jgi:MATE family multidrug resistance protein
MQKTFLLSLFTTIFSAIVNPVKKRWYESGGYKEIFILSIPLIISSGSWSLQSFIDRMFLSWYSTEALAAAMPAGMINQTIMFFFTGTAGYITTFVAQYKGAGHPEKVGPSMWQGVYLSVIGGLMVLLLIPFAPGIFRLANHSVELQSLEVTYFTFLCFGGFPIILTNALAGFKSGLGHTMAIMWANLAATAFNLVFDYLLIFGHAGFPEMGIKGAAIATTLSPVVAVCIYIILIFNKTNNRIYKVISGFKFDKKLFKRLLRFGIPNGLQFFLDMVAFALFLLFLGALGTSSLAATNIAFSINTITFMPMIGIGIAISVLVGQNQGRKKPDASVRCVWNGFHIVFAYMTSIAVLLFVIPDFFINPFLHNSNAEVTHDLKELCRILLKFVAIYTLFDSFNVLFSSALKGAGDTKYVMLINLGISIVFFIVPSYLIIFVFKLGLYEAWITATAYVCIIGISFLTRFKTGKWKTMRVIEESVIVLDEE